MAADNDDGGCGSDSVFQARPSGRLQLSAVCATEWTCRSDWSSVGESQKKCACVRAVKTRLGVVFFYVKIYNNPFFLFNNRLPIDSFYRSYYSPLFTSVQAGISTVAAASVVAPVMVCRTTTATEQPPRRYRARARWSRRLRQRSSRPRPSCWPPFAHRSQVGVNLNT